MNGTSREDLIEFLDYLKVKGLMNESTAQSRKASVNKVLGILDESNASDVFALDLDSIMTQFTHLNGKDYSPSSLSVYKGRVKNAIDDFARYRADPAGFKPISGASKKSEGGKTANSRKTTAEPKQVGRQPVATTHPSRNLVELPIPIRGDLTVRVGNLPHDLTSAEAKKIAAVITAMAISEDS